MPRGDVRLMLIDDDDVDRERIRRMLARAPFKVDMIEAASGQEALTRLDGGSVDCVLLDYHLGDAVGTDLVETIRARNGRPCPVIMITGLGSEEVAVEAMRNGAHNYLTKHQLRADHLSNAIESSLREMHLQQELEQAQQRLQRLSMFDSLTGLPNRNLFFDRLDQTLLAERRGDAAFALLMMDLNLFKEVNDSLGHVAGDQVLAHVAQRLQNLTRKSDTIARLGGDEFAMILPRTASVDGAVVMAEKIVAAMRIAIPVSEKFVTVGISIGIVLSDRHGQDGQVLLAHADEAMYRAKRGTRGYEIYAEDSARTPDRHSVLLASQLSEALDRRELFLLYQPKVDLAQRRLAGVEALVRWRSPQFGLLSPAAFIPSAERSSVINPMTYFLLDLALDQAKRWRDAGIGIPISVNLSARMFDDEQLTSRVVDALTRRGLRAEALTLEITETALMSSPYRALQTLGELSNEGIAISIDDFGSGFTSLKYLREFPVSEIKIDQLFIADLSRDSRDASIVAAVASLARGFNVDVVAEGIERPEIWDLLLNLGCNLGQGYSIGMPMLPDEIDTWAKNWIGDASSPRGAAGPSSINPTAGK